MYKCGHPSYENFKALIKTNAIKDCPVTYTDVVNCEKIFGVDPGAVKGKTVRSKTSAVRDDTIEIPPEITERDDLTLCVNIAYVWLAIFGRH
jgi:hypothetical protein